MTIPSISNLGEFGLINEIKKNLWQNPSVIKGIGDDTAVLKNTSQEYLLLTTDMLVEGVHFTQQMSAQNIGHKAIACNISDIAAMGGIPQFAVVSLGVPAILSYRFIKDLYHGMNTTAKRFHTAIVGGDTVKSEKIIVNIAMTGKVNKKQLVTRSEAKPHDEIFVTGPLGNSFKSQWHLNFVPRLSESQYLVKNFKVNSMIDISDGLAADLNHILEESHVGAVLFEERIPQRRGANLHQALHEGEDFELLFTLNPQQAKKLKQSHCSYKFYPIGEITLKRHQLMLCDQEGNFKRMRPEGYRHF